VVSLIYLTGCAYAIYRNLKDVRREKLLKAQIEVMKDEHKKQIEALGDRERAETDRLAKNVASMRDEFNERDQRYRVETEQLQKLLKEERDNSDKLSAKLNFAQQVVRYIQAPFYGRKIGLRLEGAQFGAQEDERHDVLTKVKQRALNGEADVPVSWQYLTVTDPRPFQEKFLTITFSITEREQGPRQILLPNGWFLKTLDELALQLKQIQSLDEAKIVSTLSDDNWMTQLEPWEILARKARSNLMLVFKLSKLVAIQTEHLERLDNITLLHEVEKLHQTWKACGAEVL
jgi:hypothetical protein